MFVVHMFHKLWSCVQNLPDENEYIRNFIFVKEA